jgi:hypothetical protein
LLPLTVIVKSDGFLLPPPSLITCFVTANVPLTGLSLEVLFDESNVNAEDEADDVFASIRALDFLCSFISDMGDEGEDNNDDVLSFLLSADSSYEFKSTKIDKTSVEERIKKRKLNANLAVTFVNDIFSLTCL